MRTRPLRFPLLFGILEFVVPAESAPCVDYAQQMGWRANVDVGGIVWDVDVSGSRAFVSAQPGLHVFDVSTPLSPTHLTTFDLLGEITATDPSGSYAFLAARDSALAVIDISNLDIGDAPPTLVDQIHIDGEPLALDVQDGLAAVALGSEGVSVFDVSDPTNLELLGHASLIPAVDVEIASHYVYVASGYSGFEILDVSDPGNPVSVGSLDFPLVYVGDVEAVIDAGGMADLLYLGAGGAFVSLDVSDPSQPHVIATVPIGRVDRIHIAGTRAYVGGIRGEVFVLEVSDPTHPVIVAKAVTPGFFMTGIALTGRALLCALDSQGLAVVDRSFEETISPIVTTPTSLAAGDIVASEDLAAVTAGNVQVVDISSPDQPVALGIFDPPWDVSQATFDGSFVYTVNGDAEVTIVDASDPQNLLPISTIDLGSFFSEGRLFIDGSILWVTLPAFWLRAVDVSDPVHPEIVGTVALTRTGPMRRVGDLLYVGLQDLGLAVVDVSDVEHMQVIATFASIQTDGLWIENEMLYVLYRQDLEIWRLEDPVTPVLLGSVKVTRLGGRSIEVNDGIAYVASSGGADAVDVSDPTQPRLIGMATFIDGVAGRGIEVYNDRLLISGTGRLGVFPLQCAPTVVSAPKARRESRLVIAPNPFQDETTIVMTPTRDGFANVDIYDVTGRRVRTLMKGKLPAGSHHLRWDGLDDFGVPVAPGVFLIRLEDRAGSQTAKLVLTR